MGAIYSATRGEQYPRVYSLPQVGLSGGTSPPHSWGNFEFEYLTVQNLVTLLLQLVRSPRSVNRTVESQVKARVDPEPCGYPHEPRAIEGAGGTSRSNSPIQTF